MAEIEHYVDPSSNKAHPRYDKVKTVELNLLDRATQESGRTDTKPMTVATALEQNILQNQTMAYYLARIYIFLTKLGADMQKVRFRQHMANEMAHYASDCWDVEMSTSYGWIECVGCADRSAFDLRKHSERTKQSMLVEERLPEPVQSEWFEAIPNTSKLGPKYRANCKAVVTAIENVPQSEREKWDKVLSEGGTLDLDVQFSGPEGATKVSLGKDLVQFEKQSRTEVTRKYEPHVIEPSFGIGRLLYSLLEQSYQQRKVEEVGEAREVMNYHQNILSFLHSR